MLNRLIRSEIKKNGRVTYNEQFQKRVQIFPNATTIESLEPGFRGRSWLVDPNQSQLIVSVESFF
jgi:hypothetical protein